MCFGYKTPVAAILAAMAVISHHPVVIVFGGISGGFFSVDDEFTVYFFQCILFIVLISLR
jgi:hypothetical protein